MAFNKNDNNDDNNDDTKTKQTNNKQPQIITTILWKRINHDQSKILTKQQPKPPRRHYVPNEIHYRPHESN